MVPGFGDSAMVSGRYLSSWTVVLVGGAGYDFFDVLSSVTVHVALRSGVKEPIYAVLCMF